MWYSDPPATGSGSIQSQRQAKYFAAAARFGFFSTEKRLLGSKPNNFVDF
jgi:hypothetical protein